MKEQKNKNERFNIDNPLTNDVLDKMYKQLKKEAAIQKKVSKILRKYPLCK